MLWKSSWNAFILESLLMLFASFRFPALLKNGTYSPANILSHAICRTIKTGDKAKNQNDGTFPKVVTISSSLFCNSTGFMSKVHLDSAICKGYKECQILKFV